MPKNTPAQVEALAAYGGKVSINEKEREFKLLLPVSENSSIELNLFDANLSLALEAIARSAYEKGRFDQKKADQRKFKNYLADLAGE